MNNSNINLGDESHIRIVWSCCNAVKTHNVNIFHKNLATGLPVAKTLIKNNNNCLEENDEEEKEPIDIEFIKQNADPEMMKMLSTLNDQEFKKKMRKTLLWLTSLKITKASWWVIFPKKITRWLFDDWGVVPNEKKN